MAYDEAIVANHLPWKKLNFPDGMPIEDQSDNDDGYGCKREAEPPAVRCKENQSQKSSNRVNNNNKSNEGTTQKKQAGTNTNGTVHNKFQTISVLELSFEDIFFKIS